MYELARGPLVWIAFLIFIVGSLYRITWLIRFSKKDKVVHAYMSWKHGLRSLLHWSVPFGSHNMRIRPFFTVVSFLFHICLVVTPVFVLGHTILWKESWGIGLWSLPESLSNAMTILVVVRSGLFYPATDCATGGEIRDCMERLRSSSGRCCALRYRAFWPIIRFSTTRPSSPFT